MREKIKGLFQVSNFLLDAAVVICMFAVVGILTVFIKFSGDK